MATSGRPTLARRARHRVRTRVSEYPGLYLPFARHKYPGPSPEVISSVTEFVIDGYTRSASTFAVYALQLAQRMRAQPAPEQRDEGGTQAHQRRAPGADAVGRGA